MKDYKAIYDSKFTTVEEALKIIEDGDFIGCSGSGNLPINILTKLHLLREYGKKNIRVHHSGPIRGRFEYLVNPLYKDTFRVNASFFNDITREVMPQGVASFFPADVYIGEKSVPNNVFICSVTPPDAHGYVKSSLSFLGEAKLLENAEKIIAEVNPNLPNTNGDHVIPIERIDYFVDGTNKLIQYPEIELTETELTIGKYVGTLVEDGSTIQLGIGGIPNACAKAFTDKNDLGVHSEMITTTMAELAMRGNINGSRKTLHKGKIIGGFALGSQLLYDFIADNPSVYIMDGRYVNNPFNIMQNHKMVSINTCLQVDLTGQVCSESIGPRQYSGIGGACNFAQGAHFCKEGKAILALKSTAKKGTVSTISAMLTPGSIVSIPRTAVDYVVTEYGIADLSLKNVQQRVEALISVAHPKFRDALREQAVELGITVF